MVNHILLKVDGKYAKTLEHGRVLTLETISVDGVQHHFLKLDGRIIDGDVNLAGMLEYHNIALED